ncbi:MAG: GNAT family N-acetyltransferase, partial [Candidatus Dormibacteraeota bacterium]|nr:GNAT family N-acetyltransferase [Candidatus Dormibacteraeota bacterium]
MVGEVLSGRRARLRPVRPTDREQLARLFSEPEVVRWWGDTSRAVEEAMEESEAETHFIIEVDGECAGFIQYVEENDPMYRHAGIDIALGSAWQDQGLGPDALRTLA